MASVMCGMVAAFELAANIMWGWKIRFHVKCPSHTYGGASTVYVYTEGNAYSSCCAFLGCFGVL